jgi:hypothetical protein
MDPTSVKEPVAVAETELKVTAMNAAANHQSLGATFSRPDRLMEANGIDFIEPALHGAVRSDNGTSVPSWIRGGRSYHNGSIASTTRKPTSESGDNAKRKSREADRQDELS